MDTEYIDSAEQLENLCERLRDSPFLVLDTEFIREKTYHPRLCLLQVATDSVVACVDPLRLESLDPLLERIYDPAVTKVLHSAHQDLEIFSRLRDAPPRPVFDTQIAATLLGHGDHTGYANLVHKVLGVRLDKAHTRTDWSQRPLDGAQIRYAADDVRYLVEVYHVLRRQLQEAGRLEWLQEDFEALVDPALYHLDPQGVWTRVRGNNILKGVQLNVLRALAAWREEQAIGHDKPRRWILSDQVLLDLARSMPKDQKKLERIRGLAANTRKTHGRHLLDLIAQARGEPPETWPVLPRVAHLDSEQEAVVDMLMACVRITAGQHRVTAGNLANRRDLERLLAGDRSVPVLHGWRRAIAGETVMRVLQGEAVLAVEGQAPKVLPRPGLTPPA